MRKPLAISFLALLLLSFGVIAQAQDVLPPKQDDASAKNTSNIAIEEGAQARLSLQTQLSSKLNEVGDQVSAVLYEPIRASDGRTAVPRGTEFTGRITQIQAAKKPQKGATMTVVFETMHMPYGTEKISTVVTAIDDYANDEKYRAKSDEGKVNAGKSGGKTTENTAKGAGIGGIGAVIVGAAGGGLAGIATAIGVGAAGGVLMTKGNEIRLQPGTILRVRFERALAVPVLTEPAP
jgi:hypothetical protein